MVPERYERTPQGFEAPRLDSAPAWGPDRLSMTKTEYREYLASSYWQNRRKQFLQYIEGCAKCRIPRWLASITYDQDLHVHHKSYVHLGCEPDDDLKALCRRCHEIETFGRSSLRPPWSEECTVCDNPCFDPYSYEGRCAACSSAEFWPNSKEQFDEFYQQILACIYRKLGADKLLAELSNIETQEKLDREMWPFGK